MFSLEIVKEIVKESFSYAETFRKLNKPYQSNNFKKIKQYIKDNNLDISHWTGKAVWKNKTLPYESMKLIPLEKVLIENSRYDHGSLKKRIIKHNLLPNKCSECGLSNVWNNKPIVLVLDHINGVNNDNRIINLRFLCPNCNSQQSTFCRGQNKSILSKDIRDKKLIESLKNEPTIHKALISAGFTTAQGNYKKALKFIERIKKTKKEQICTTCNKPFFSKNKQKYCSYNCVHKGTRKAKRPTKYTMLKLVAEYPMIKIGEMFNVSDNAIRKWCKSLEITKEDIKFSHKNKKVSDTMNTEQLNSIA